MSGVKHDQEKPQMDLLSSIWVKGVAQVLTFGARKYAAHNWRKGIHQSRLLGAALRHVFAFLGGEDKDPETGLCHLDHASCCLMFARELWETHPELDDRFKQEAVKRAEAVMETKPLIKGGHKCAVVGCDNRAIVTWCPDHVPRCKP